MSAAWQWLSLVALLLGLFAPAFTGPFAPPPKPATPEPVLSSHALQESSLTLVSPAVCPAGGCAPGQRLNLRFEYGLTSYSPLPDPQPKAKVCLYAPNNWVDAASVSTDATGGMTSLTYNPVDNCAEDAAPPTGYQLIAARETTINITAFGDSLGFALRVAGNANTAGTLLARLFEQNAGVWVQSKQAFTTSIPIAAASGTAYVAASPAACDIGTYSPCYVNSGDDLAGGLGTGLKDAADVIADGSTIYLVGSYQIKSNAVQINKAIILTGLAGSSLSYAGNACTNPMLTLKSGVTVRSLDVTDGPNCTTANRTLIEIDSPSAVLIESNYLRAGDRAVFIRDNTGGATIRYNQIEGNAGHAIYWDGVSGTAPLEVVGNNIVRNGATIYCGGQTANLPYRLANHNYWGSPSLPAGIPDTHCTIGAGKQLGAPILAKTTGPGVQVQRVTVTETKTYAPGLDNQIGYQRTGGSNFDLYIVNHGFASETYLPFTLSKAASPSPCSNYFDVFLADDVVPTGTLELFITYKKTSACIATINSTQFCEQTTDKAKYPLWWYDPSTFANNNLTDYWDTTGQRPAGPNANNANGQTTACNPASNEIQVSIDNDGRPNLTNDMSHLPMMTGIQILKSFDVASSNNVVTINWTTQNEPDITGFHVMRSLDGVNFDPITDVITRKGQASSGGTYQYIDSGRVSGTKYYYQIKMLRTDNYAMYSNILEVSAVSATATITPTPGPTATATFTPGPSPTLRPPTSTLTRVPTDVPTRVPTRIPTQTPIPPQASSTRPVLTLVTNTPTRLTPGTTSPTTSGTPGLAGTGTVTPAGGTAVAAITPDTTGYPAPTGDGSSGYPDPVNPADPAYPAPGETQQQGTAGTPPASTPQAGGTQTATTPTAISGANTTNPAITNPTLVLLRNLLTGYSLGMALLGLAAILVFYIRRK